MKAWKHHVLVDIEDGCLPSNKKSYRGTGLYEKEISHSGVATILTELLYTPVLIIIYSSAQAEDIDSFVGVVVSKVINEQKIEW